MVVLVRVEADSQTGMLGVNESRTIRMLEGTQ